MSDATRDRIEGTIDEATGHGKSAWGELTGDEATKAEGEAQQTEGAFKQGMANVKDKIDDVVKNVTGN